MRRVLVPLSPDAAAPGTAPASGAVSAGVAGPFAGMLAGTADTPAASLLPDPAARLLRLGGETMGTTWSVICAVPTTIDVRSLNHGIRATLDDIVAQMSNWIPDSDIGRFNAAPAGTWHALPEACFTVLRRALEVARESGGAYDPSAGPLVDLWGFGPPGPCAEPPATRDVEWARARCGWARITLDDQERRALQPGGVSLDLCAIAKGYAVDAVSHYLAGQDVHHHLVEIGGELRGRGVKPDGLPWWVELETPPATPATPNTTQHGHAAIDPIVVALHGLSVATSGDYRRYFDDDGRRYAHTLDPRTGYPASHALASVTVVHPDCMMADALSTALTVLGPQAGMHYAGQRRIAARFLVRTPEGFEETLTPAFAAMLA